MIPPPLNGKDADSARRTYLVHEGRVKSLCWLYRVMAIVALFIAVLVLAGPLHVFIRRLWIGIPVLSFAVFLWITGSWVRRLDPRAIEAVSVTAALSLVLVPLGTAVGAHILWIIHSQRGRAVFSRNYSTITDMTPDLRPRVSGFVVLTAGLIIAALLFALVKCFIILKDLWS
jgi:hypothetical protein